MHQATNPFHPPSAELGESPSVPNKRLGILVYLAPMVVVGVLICVGVASDLIRKKPTLKIVELGALSVSWIASILVALWAHRIVWNASKWKSNIAYWAQGIFGGVLWSFITVLCVFSSIELFEAAKNVESLTATEVFDVARRLFTSMWPVLAIFYVPIHFIYTVRLHKGFRYRPSRPNQSSNRTQPHAAGPVTSDR